VGLPAGCFGATAGALGAGFLGASAWGLAGLGLALGAGLAAGFFAVMRIRGMESNSPSRLAEGFYGRKVVLAAAAPGERRSADKELGVAAAPMSTPLLDTV